MGDDADRPPSSEDTEKRRQETLKLMYDLFKHMTTLSTASILIIAALLGRFPTLESGAPVGSLAMFAVSTLASVLGMLSAIRDMREPSNLFSPPVFAGKDDADLERSTKLTYGRLILRAIFTGSYGGFLFGVLVVAQSW